jgi:hypothetical protein
VAAIIAFEHCENSAALDPEETNEYMRKPLPAGLQLG